MAYLRPCILPSGNRCETYIIGAKKGLVNTNRGNFIPYPDIKKLIEEETEEDFKWKIGRRLAIWGEELDFFVQRLYAKYDSGEMDIVV